MAISRWEPAGGALSLRDAFNHLFDQSFWAPMGGLVASVARCRSMSTPQVMATLLKRRSRVWMPMRSKLRWCRAR